MDCEKLISKLVDWLRQRVSAAGCRGVVLGMSGGIDSAVLGVLCARAFPDNVLGVIMPCHSIESDKVLAETVAAKFSIPLETVVLDDIYTAMLNNLPDGEVNAALTRLARANLKARLRMVTLYYFANQRRYLVAGSGNRSELTVGYFTKHGDSGVDILPLGNLVKGQVRELAVYLGVPQEIIDRPPSAGLWEGQTDEAEMGFSYEELDKYILTGQVPPEVKARIDAMKAAGRHKLAMPPIADV